jgi:hypothetical protein
MDHVAPPPVDGEWDRFGTVEAAKGWPELCAQFANSTREAFDQMRANPRPPQDSTHYQLRAPSRLEAFRADHFSNGRSRSAAAAGSGTSQTMRNAQYGLCTRRRRIRDRPTECPERRLQHSARGPEGYAAAALIRS